MKKLYNSALIMISVFMSCSSAWCQNSNWTQVGPVAFPTNVSGQIHGIGRVSQIQFDPVNTNRMYAVAAHSLFVSNDTANSWSIVPGSDDFPISDFASLCIDHTNNNVLYLGTGDANYYTPSGASGVWKSTDGGATFMQSNTGMGNKLVLNIIMSPLDHNILVAATNAGLYRSTDGGASWTLTSASAKFTDMCIKPAPNSTTLYAVEKDTQNFYLSTDFGITWTINTLSATLPSNGGRVNVSIADPNVVYVAYVGTNAYNKSGIIYKSTDSGLTFTLKKGDGMPAIVAYNPRYAETNSTPPSLVGQGNYNFDIAVDPLDANTLYSCAHVVCKSTDGGSTWTQVQTAWATVLHTDQHDLMFNPANPDQLFNANDGGVWLNTNHVTTNSWTPKSDGVAATEIYTRAFANSHGKKDLISIGTQDNGELYFKDGAWYTNRGGDYTSKINFDNANANKAYYIQSGQRRDLVNASTVSPVSLGLPVAATNGDFYAFSNQDGNIGFYAYNNVSASTYGLYSTNNLQSNTPSWSAMNGFVPSGEITAMAVSPVDANVLYILSNNKKVVRSTNALGTAQFTQVSSAPKPTWTPTIGCLSVSRSGTVYMSNDGYVYRSTDQGITWTVVGTGSITTTLNGQKIKSLIADTNNPAKEAVYALTDQSVYYIDNTLTDWAYFSTNIPTSAKLTGMDIFNDPINPANNALRISSYGRGIWQTPIESSIGQLPSVAITSPTDAASVAEGSAIQIDATATDADGTIAKVQFFLDGVLLGEDTQAPYSFTATNMQPGAHTIMAKTFDNLSNQATSASVSIFVNTVIAIADAFVRDGSYATSNYGTAPVLTLKKDGTSYSREVFLKFDLNTLPESFTRATLNLNINTAGATTNTTKWELYYVPTDSWSETDINWSNKPAASTLLTTVNGQLSGWAKWNIAPQVLAEMAGDKILTLKLVSTVVGGSTDASFDSKETAISALRPQIAVSSMPNEGPTVAITSPTNNTKYTGPLNITINADASDAEGSVTKVDFYNGTTKLFEDTTAPYSFIWNNVPIGNYSITAQATDNVGTTTVSAPVTVIVEPSYSLLPVADAYVRDGTHANSNFGTATTLAVKKDGLSFSRVSYLKFNLSQYQTDTFDVGKLKLAIQLAGTGAPSADYQLWYCSNDSWTESGINWNNQPALTTLLATQKGKATGNVMEWDIKNILKTEINGDKTLTLAIVSITSGGTYDVNFHSKEALVNISLKPQIIAEDLPKITLSSPTDGTVVNQGTALTVSANATDDKAVSNVKFFIDGVEKGTVNIAPYNWNTPNLENGTYVIMARVTDNSGLTTDSAPVTITVKDLIAPQITCPDNIAVSNDVDQCGAIVDFAVTASDNSGFTAITYSHEPGSLFPKGTTTVTATAKDAEGNTANCTFTVTVNDTQAPVVTVQNLETVTGECSASVTTAPTATDNCAGTIVGTTTDATTFEAQGTYTIHWTYDDGNGNTSTQDQTVIVDDTIAPVANVQDLPTITEQCSASVTTAPTATDNCAGTIVGTTADATTFEAQGTYIIHWTYDDGNGNTSTQDQTVIVHDTSVPTIVCPENIILSACESTATWSVPTVNGGCPNTTATQIAGPAPGSTFESGTSTTITYAVSNASGTVTNTCSFTVTRQSALDVTVSNSNPQLYYGYSLDQSTVVTGTPTGGVAPYTVSITMDRPLKSNVITNSGDEIWTVESNNSVTATLMETAIITVTVTDANGCSVSKTTTVNAEDARCFAGNNTKIKLCHKPGNNNSCVELCVEQSSVQAHLDHGDFLGACTSNCIAPSSVTSKMVQKEVVDVTSAFKVIAYPNPTHNQFNLALEGGNNEKVEVFVYDMQGRKLKQFTRKAGDSIEFGLELPTGEYLTVVKQGENVKTLNLIKK